MRWLALSTVLVCCAAPAAHMDGRELLEACAAEPRDNVSSASVCLAYLMGVNDSYTLRRREKGQPNHPYCAPAAVTPEQLQQAVVGWLATHTSLLHHSGSLVAHLALMQAYPCD